MKVLSLVGRSGVGKTALLELAFQQLSQRGISALAVKSSHHDLADSPGTDSHRLAEAGAEGVVLLGKTGIHLFSHPLTLEEILRVVAGRYEVALVEGGKQSGLPKVELVGTASPMLALDQVVERLPRGRSATDLAPVLRFLQLLESHGEEVGGAI